MFGQIAFGLFLAGIIVARTADIIMGILFRKYHINY